MVIVPAPSTNGSCWHALPESQLLISIESDGCLGLTAAEARLRLERNGPNTLFEHNGRSLLAVFAGQFKSPLIYLLFVAAGVALALGHRGDAAVIAIVVLLNAVIGALQEGRAAHSLQALRRLAPHRARVVRGGLEFVIEARELVPGDLLLLEAGDAVAADARLLQGASLHIAEAALTGESVPVLKSPLTLALEAVLPERLNMLYAGTHVTSGRARAVVVATGPATEIGRIAALADSAVQPKTPLERRIAAFGRNLIIAAVAMFVVVNVIGWLRGLPGEQILMVAISQVVGMIPEGLPVAMTIALAVVVQRMAHRGAVVRRLAAVETLGSIAVICSDKTGTLTRNEMTVTSICLPEGRELTVTGAGYDPQGAIFDDAVEVDLSHASALRSLLEAGVLCNDAVLQAREDCEPHWRPIGDPTEVALLTLAIKGSIIPGELRARWPRRAEIPFDPTTKMMATQHDTPGGPRIFLKGAPEVLLHLCVALRGESGDRVLDDDDRVAIHRSAERMAERALRVLAFGVVDGVHLDGHSGFACFQQRVTLLGLLGEIDPPRAEAKAAVERCRRAGIRPVMVTGDHKATGYAIAQSLGIARDGDIAMDGRELELLSDAELEERIDDISVFARVLPAQKLRIVGAYQKRGAVVAMTGDGVNDAPALVKADVGVAMGIAGTEVAKESANIIIGDDNFATIVAAVEEGRVVHRNIKKVLLYLFSTSMAEGLILLTALILGYPPPLAAVQILWINLVTEGTVTVNLIMEPAEGDEMDQQPVSVNEPLLSRTLLMRLALMTPTMAASTLGWFAYRLSTGVPFAQVQSETFTVLAVCQWFNVLNCRSERSSSLNLGLLKNRWLIGGLVASNVLQAGVIFFPPLGRVFHTVPFGLQEAIAIAAVSSLVLWVEEVRKWVVRRRQRRLASVLTPSL